MQQGSLTAPGTLSSAASEAALVPALTVPASGAIPAPPEGETAPPEGVIPADYKIPHIGWNALHFPADKPRHKLLETVQDNECVYFVHSFYATDCTDAVIATTEYGAELTAAVARGNVMGCQFHPEKSGDVGLAILKTFCEGSW